MEDDPARQQFRAGLAVEEELVPVCGEIVQGGAEIVIGCGRVGKVRVGSQIPLSKGSFCVLHAVFCRQSVAKS
jgi:hypothetical protein